MHVCARSFDFPSQASETRTVLRLEQKHLDQHHQNSFPHRYHEAGHALMGAMVPDYDLVTKVTMPLVAMPGCAVRARVYGGV